MTHVSPTSAASLHELLTRLATLTGAPRARADDPLDALRREFLANNWREARTGLLARTSKLRIVPLDDQGPSAFSFELDVPYKRCPRGACVVELAQGPVRGVIRYHPRLFAAGRGEPSVLVTLADESTFHPNFSRQFGVLCLGPVAGPFGLEALAEHLHALLVYSTFNLDDPADVEAAHWFAHEPEALAGLRDPTPLYGGPTRPRKD